MITVNGYFDLFLMIGIRSKSERASDRDLPPGLQDARKRLPRLKGS
jgi:hypothetical protein